MKRKYKYSLIALLGLAVAAGAVGFTAHRAEASRKAAVERPCHCWPDCRPPGANCI